GFDASPYTLRARSMIPWRFVSTFAVVRRESQPSAIAVAAHSLMGAVVTRERGRGRWRGSRWGGDDGAVFAEGRRLAAALDFDRPQLFGGGVGAKPPHRIVQAVERPAATKLAAGEPRDAKGAPPGPPSTSSACWGGYPTLTLMVFTFAGRRRFFTFASL